MKGTALKPPFAPVEKTGLLCLLVALSCLPLRADTIVMKNGNKLEGIIQKETAGEIVLNIGVGSVTLKKAQVASIHRATEAEAAKLKNQWQEHYVTHEKYVPAGQEDLAAGFQGLVDSRTAALNAVADLKRWQKEQQVIADQEAAVKAEIARKMEAIQRMDVPTEAEKRQYGFSNREINAKIDAYNMAVVDLNNLRARIIGFIDAMQQGMGRGVKQRQFLAQYVTALFAFKQKFDERRSSNPGGADPRQIAVFFESIQRRLDEYMAEVREVDLPFRENANQVIVKARLNDDVEASMLVDTGASVVSLSEELARRLRLPIDETGPVEVTVADGRTTTAKPAILNSVEVSGMRVQNVAAMVTSNAPGPGIQGLLGMTYLAEFGMTLDPANRKLSLFRFDPK